MAKCENCKNLNHILNSGVSVGRWCVEKSDSPDIERERICDKYVPKTNADRIRSMTDEELSDFILETISEAGENMYLCSEYEKTEYCIGHSCKKCGAMLKWLKSEAWCE